MSRSSRASTNVTERFDTTNVVVEDVEGIANLGGSVEVNVLDQNAINEAFDLGREALDGIEDVAGEAIDAVENTAGGAFGFAGDLTAGTFDALADIVAGFGLANTASIAAVSEGTRSDSAATLQTFIKAGATAAAIIAVAWFATKSLK